MDLSEHGPAVAALIAVIGLLVKELRPSARERDETLGRVKRIAHANNRMAARLCEHFDLEAERVE